MSPSEYADHAGVSKARVTQMMQEGKLDGAWQMNELGKKRIEVAKADELIGQRVRQQANTVGQRKHDNGTPFVEGKVESAKPNYGESRAVREAYNARLAKLDYEERQGKLVEADKVRLQAFELARKVRDALLAIPDRVASTCAHETSEHEIHKLISDEIVQVLQRLTEDAKR